MSLCESIKTFFLFPPSNVNKSMQLHCFIYFFPYICPLYVCKDDSLEKKQGARYSIEQISSVTLLMTFLIGQFIVYTHSHKPAVLSIVDCNSKKHHADHPKCSICDQNSHPQLLFSFNQSEFLLPEREIVFGLFVPGDQMVRGIAIGQSRSPHVLILIQYATIAVFIESGCIRMIYRLSLFPVLAISAAVFIMNFLIFNNRMIGMTGHQLDNAHLRWHKNIYR
jgi:hypothetical protein